jgi:signal peptidase II
MRLRNTLALLALLVSCVGCDQASKQAAQYWLQGVPTLSFLSDSVRLLFIENRGAFLSLGADWPEPVRFWVFTVLSSAMVAWGLVWVFRNNHGPWSKPQALTVLGGVLLAAGGLGNAIDRIVRDGAVIDFMNVGIGSLRTGIFNVADVQIVAGILLLAFASNRAPTTETAESTAAPPA